jgi:hypothetical protein
MVLLGSTASGLVCLSRVTEDLASASLFVENIACSHHTGQGRLFNHRVVSFEPIAIRIQQQTSIVKRKDHPQVA